jgi:hypothetical protein
LIGDFAGEQLALELNGIFKSQLIDLFRRSVVANFELQPFAEAEPFVLAARDLIFRRAGGGSFDLSSLTEPGPTGAWAKLKGTMAREARAQKKRDFMGGVVRWSFRHRRAALVGDLFRVGK